jgi:hypothetical protein
VSEPTQQQPNEATPIETELTALRNANKELHDKRIASKKRISELEASLVERDSQLATANASLRAIMIDSPLKNMGESISTAPELWTKLFNEHYKLELKEGALKLLTLDGQPVQKDGKDVPFERQALISLLTNEEHPAARNFSAITIVSRASGAQSPSTKIATPAKQTFNFGLR